MFRGGLWLIRILFMGRMRMCVWFLLPGKARDGGGGEAGYDTCVGQNYCFREALGGGRALCLLVFMWL